MVLKCLFHARKKRNFGNKYNEILIEEREFVD